MSRREAALLWDLVESIDAISTFVGTMTLAEFLDNALVRSAVERHLITIGEVFVRLEKGPGAAERMGAPVRQVVGMRNTIVHGYDRIDDATIYRVVTDDLPVLRAAATRELETLDAMSTERPPDAGNAPTEGR